MYASDGNEDAIVGRVEFHLSDGFTEVSFWAAGLQFADIPTELVPTALREAGTWLSLKFHTSEGWTVEGPGNPPQIYEELLKSGTLPTLVVPEKVVLRLVDSEGNSLRLPKVLIFVRAFATSRKNDFRLGPFVTDAEGVATITKRDLLAEAAANIETGLMDYDPVESCGPFVEIAAMEPQEVEKALEARTTIWTKLLTGESERWRSIEDLCNIYRTATNKLISAKAIRVRWDGSANEFEYAVTTAPLAINRHYTR